MSVHTLTRRCATTYDQPTLTLNDSGPDVEAMQQLLNESTRGFSPASIYKAGNTFGPALELLVKDFQRQAFLIDDGIVGPKTWRALCADGPVDRPVLRQGDRSTAVRQAQTRLVRVGHRDVVVDGDFGPITHRAVTRFQQHFNLTVDGIIGSNTWEALSRV